MADNTENDLDLDLGEDQVDINKTQLRIQKLSEKVKLTSQERDDLKEGQNKLNQEKDSLAKERDFYKSTSELTAKYPNASGHLEEIKNKVMAGYDVEDATVAVLAKAGALNIQSPPPVKTPVGGGSATNNIQTEGPKPINEMNREEKRQALFNAESKGDIGLN